MHFPITRLNKPDFFDEKGLVADNPPFRNLENLSVWTYYYYSLMLNIENLGYPKAFVRLSLNSAIMSLYGRDNEFHPCPNHDALPEEGMSRDNMMAITSSGLLLLGLFFASRLPTSIPLAKPPIVVYDCEKMFKAGIRQFSYRYLQPQDICYFLYTYLVFSKRRWFMDIKKWVLLPLLIPTFLSMAYACLCRKTTRTGAFDTNGVLLTYMRTSAMLSLFGNSNLATKAFLFFVVKLARRSTGSVYPVSFCIHEYFRNPDHPIHRLVNH